MDQLNPARRLHTILNVALQQKSDLQPRQVWQSAFEQLDDNNIGLPEVDFQIAEIFQLLSETERAVSQLKNVGSKDTYLKPIQELRERFLSKSLIGGKWGDIAQNLRANFLMDRLAACADTIALNAQRSGMRTLEDEELTTLLEQVENALRQLDQLELDADFKFLLTTRLEDIIRAIRYYKIGGSECLQREAHAAIGTMLVYQKVSEEMTEDEKKCQFDVWELLRRIQMLTSLADKFPPVLDGMKDIAQHLLGGS